MLEAYHFQWRSSFDGHLTVQATRTTRGCDVAVERGWFVEPYSPLRQLGASEWHRLERAMTLAAFWSPRAPLELIGLDGAMWLIEGWKGDRHQAIDLWSPDDPRIRSIGRLFAEISGFPDLILY